MVTLTVGRLHARYAVDRPATAARLDDCLRRVLDGELDAAMTGLALPVGHVCVPRLTVRVRLDSTGVAAARSWAAEIAAALERAVAERPDGVVVYPRTLDALVDLLVSAGRADLRRAWAWRQVGLLAAGTDPGRPDLAAQALAGEPELACAALVAAAAAGPLPLTAAGWVAVARAVDELTPPVRDEEAGPLPDVLATPVARRLPTRVAVLPSADRLAVAGLLLLCVAPALARSAPARAAVAGALTRPAAGPPDSPDPAAGPDLPAGADPAAGVAGSSEPAGCAAEPAGPPSPGGAGEPPGGPAQRRTAARPSTSDGETITGPRPDPAWPAPPSVPDRDPDPAAPAPVAGPNPDAGSATPAAGPPADRVSPAGGVLFLLALAPELDLPEPLDRLPLPTVYGWLAAYLGEVPPDDPAVHVLSGQPPEPPDPPGPVEEAALHLLAGRVRDRQRTALALEPDDDLRWLWCRSARIAAEPGWVEATFALADVDTRVRAAGLDLDPGFVWWLGAVVRYRYA
jgi:hypothetical protein